MQEGQKPLAAHDRATHRSGADLRGARRRSEAEPEGLDERFEAFLQRRRTETVSRRRQRKYLVAIASLGVVCLALAVSVVLLAVRPSAVQVPSDVVPGAPGPAATPEVALPRGSAAMPSVAQSPPLEAVEPPVEPPSRSARPATREAIAPEPALAPEAPYEAEPARRMAAWMLRRYGKAGAEERARGVAAFLDPQHPNADFWKSVLAHIRSAPEQ